MTRATSRLVTVALIAAAALAGTTTAHAAAVQSYMYNTAGTLGGTAGSGYPISFSGQSNAMLTTPGTFVLGGITTNPLPPGATLLYENTPFTINLGVGSVPSGSSYSYGYPYGDYGFNPAYTYQINGVLNGSLKGDGTSTLFPTVVSVTGFGATPPFDVAALKFNLQGIAAPIGGTYGVTMLTAHVDVAGVPLPEPAPEPTSVAIFAAAVAGYAWNRGRRRARPGQSAPSPAA